MGSVVKGLFGGSDDSAQKAQLAANDRTQEFIEEQAALGRSDALGLFPQAQEQRQLSFQQALDAMTGAAPEQARLYGEGNYGAQQALLGGMQPFQQAILGQPIDTSGMQAQQLTPNFDWMQTQLAIAQPTEGSPVLDAPETGGDVGNWTPPASPGGSIIGPQGPTQGFQGGIGQFGSYAGGLAGLQPPQMPYQSDNQLLVRNPLDRFKMGG